MSIFDPDSRNRVPSSPFTFQRDRNLTDVDEIAFPQTTKFYKKDEGSFDSESYLTISSTGDAAVEQNGANNNYQKIYLNPDFMCDGDINWSESNQTMGAKFNPSSVNDEIGDKIYSELDTFQDIFAVWELCRIIYIPSKQEYNQFGQFSSDLLKWINTCFPLSDLTEDEEEQLEQNQERYRDDLFWTQGRINKILMILRGHTRTIIDESSSWQEALGGLVYHTGAILMELLKAQVAPISFWPVLLLNALPLLQEEILRNLQDITSFVYQDECLACIERLKKWHTQENGYSELDKNLTALRLALLQNSADCYIENSSSPWMFE
ncbi:7442_t:CDS:2 [Racocetra fulgida]|uniref:Nuclear pore complex protein Nup85 n=1 Tax=Racocetra fulgida TaxID=60492 RepID=A0A9N9GJ01_9GLOM|nr:7442_t:CDS:2 [Racocetra fulgida]